jgi:hypothetical protein
MRSGMPPADSSVNGEAQKKNITGSDECDPILCVRAENVENGSIPNKKRELVHATVGGEQGTGTRQVVTKEFVALHNLRNTTLKSLHATRMLGS